MEGEIGVEVVAKDAIFKGDYMWSTEFNVGFQTRIYCN
jgi:hypothetical protein